MLRSLPCDWCFGRYKTQIEANLFANVSQFPREYRARTAAASLWHLQPQDDFIIKGGLHRKSLPCSFLLQETNLCCHSIQLDLIWARTCPRCGAQEGVGGWCPCPAEHPFPVPQPPHSSGKDQAGAPGKSCKLMLVQTRKERPGRYKHLQP